MGRFRAAEGGAALCLIILSCFHLIMVVDSEVTEPGPPNTPRTPPSLVPLCISQFALVNHACSLIPYYALPPPGPPTIPPSDGGFDGGDGGDGGDYGGSDIDSIDNVNNNSSRVLDNGDNQNSTRVELQRHNSERNHSNHSRNSSHSRNSHSRSSHSRNSHRGSSHEHRRHHRRHRSRSPQEQPSHMTTTQQDCCRWLNAVDSRCVCDVLFRLPVFLSKPVHVYSVIVHDECVVTFQCPAKFIL